MKVNFTFKTINHFFCRYAGSVMEVYKVNEELNKQLKEVSSFTAQFSADAGFKLEIRVATMNLWRHK